MNTMELDAQRIVLAREILNTDNSELLKEMSKAYKRIKARMIKTADPKVAVAPEPDSKEYIMNGLKEAFLQLNEYKAGRIQARPLDELLKELEEEDGDDRNK